MSMLRQTRFSDVCGTVDELKRMLKEEPDTKILADFVEDCVCMIDRMDGRLQECLRFRRELSSLVDRMEMIANSRRPFGLETAAKMKERLGEGRALDAGDVSALSSQAEDVRGVAGELEQLLRRYKEIAIEVGRAFRKFEGGRSWDLEAAQADAAGIEGRLAAWLPGPPHRERILDYLKKGRARLLPAEGDDPPLVEFEDGGFMALTAVRWSEEVANFVPASFNPNARAQLYRGRKATGDTPHSREEKGERRKEKG